MQIDIAKNGTLAWTEYITSIIDFPAKILDQGGWDRSVRGIMFVALHNSKLSECLNTEGHLHLFTG